MILSPDTLVHHLLERGLVDPAAVVDGDLVVADASRRNRNFRVRAGAGPGLFVKQPQDWEPHSVETLRREAACYLLARDHPRFAALGALLPRLVDHDPRRQVLVLEMVPGAETLGDHHRREGRLPGGVPARLGALLGGYHGRAGAPPDVGDAPFPRGIPWILDLVRNNPSRWGRASGGNLEMLGIVSAYPGFGAALDALRAEWRGEALVHGDLKWENCLVAQEEGGAPAVRIVDWELADVGDPGWDVGSLFQSWLSAWVLSIRDADHAPPERLPSLAALPLEGMQPEIRAFWTAYASTLGASPEEAEERLLRATRLCGARMLQTAWEHTAYAADVSPTLLCLLQVALGVLSRPADAARGLLGISAEGAA